MARPTKAKALERLRKALNEASELKETSLTSPAFVKWRRDTEIAIVNTFVDNPDYIKQFRFQLLHSDRENLLKRIRSFLESMIDEVKEYWNEEETSSNTPDKKPDIRYDNKKIFVIHGRAEATRETVSRFLERLGFEPVILHEKPNQGRTIIEKFQDYADVGFAVVLLTPDDVGALAGNEDELEPRARQNVILELGFFLGKLGRDRVCPLVKGDVEWPSDYDGIVHTRFDDGGGWKMKLGQELKAAGFAVDMNRAFQT